MVFRSFFCARFSICFHDVFSEHVSNFLFFSRCARKARTCVASHKNQWILMIFQGALLRRRRRQDEETFAKQIKKSLLKIWVFNGFSLFFRAARPCCKNALQNGFWEPLREPPGSSRAPPGRPKTAPGGAKSDPRWPQEPPRAPQELPRELQKALPDTPGGPQRPPRGLRGGILESFWEHFRTHLASVFEHSAPHFQRLPLTCFRHLRFLLFSFSSVPHAKEEQTQSRNKSITCPEDTQRSSETHAKCR